MRHPACFPRPVSPGGALGPLRALGALIVLLMLGACAISPRIGADDRQHIAGKTFVVTGASSGFGRGVALELASQGANVVLAARRVTVLEEVAEEVRTRGGVPLVVATDVGRQEDVRRLADAAVSRFGAIDVWINNAGVLAIGRFEDIPVEDHARLVQTNVMGVIYGSHAAMRLFRAQGRGVLVNVGSAESVVPLAYHASYSASKAAVLGLGRALDQEIRLGGERDIHVATVLPWAADTPVSEHAANYSGRTPRLISMDDPQTVVDAIVWVSIHPQDTLPVGWKARGVYVMHHLLPGTTESIAADMAHREQMEKAPPAPATGGALYRPLPAGTGVDGGNRARQRMEDAQTGGGS
ncbi:SDR family NAD(P)-dependent oxidoreductase [Bordetella bronchialis]|uniref:SDR family NAD(P)-dependent oxidoreductase n=1 Tax=Bordetella bronchialis TaxID=463025 RepID=UPI0009F4826C|nr:SDR family NAD(P)-dependent oxidoreductase [Bordetella bronchialis]